jgi:hypothetical protein
MKIKKYNDFVFEKIEPSKNFVDAYNDIAEKFEHFWQTLKLKLGEMEKINSRDEEDVIIYNKQAKVSTTTNISNLNPPDTAADAVAKKQPINPKIGSEKITPEYQQEKPNVTTINTTNNPEYQQEKPDPSKRVFVDEKAKEGRRQKRKQLEPYTKLKKPGNETEDIGQISTKKPIGPKVLAQTENKNFKI